MPPALPTDDTTLSDPVPAAGEVQEADSAPPSDDAEAARRKAEEKAAEKAEALRRQRLTLLMQSIDAQPDFATLKDSMVEMQKVSRSEKSHTRALTDLIYNDPTMLSKLLRLVNAAYYSAVGGGQITSMHRAVHLMGFQNICMLASSLMIFDRLPQGTDGDRLRNEFARGQLGASLALAMCTSRKHVEDIYVATLFQRLGDLLAGLHFHEDAQVLEDQLDAKALAPGSAARHEEREVLARQYWGMTIEEIGLDVASRWGWPPQLLVGMRSLRVDDPEKVLEGDEYQRVLCTFANTLAEELMRLPEEGTPEERDEARKAFVLQYANDWLIPLGLNPETIGDIVNTVRTHWLELIKALGVTLTPGGVASSSKKKQVDMTTSEYRKRLAEDLADAVDELTRMNKRGASVMEVTDSALRLIHKTLDLQRAIVCLRNGDGRLEGKLGVGSKAVVLSPHFNVPLTPPECLFGLLCAKSADTLISDSSEGTIARHLPGWFKERVKAGTFLVLPIVHNGAVLGMLYGDQPDAGQIVINERALTLLKNLRNQVLHAMRQPPKA
ncbi:MAG: HDOD domain-containing protein [Burkholderiaceae bacterium]|nr:MAG: HDOD domain-containing protein [Burkholderiaceae bacterium]